MCQYQNVLSPQLLSLLSSEAKFIQFLKPGLECTGTEIFRLRKCLVFKSISAKRVCLALPVPKYFVTATA